MKKKETIFQLLTQKPWDPAQAKIDNMHDGETLNLSKGKLGLRYIMIVSSIFFSLFIITYSDRLVYADWQRMPEPLLLWFNTIVLFISSAFFINTQIAAKNYLWSTVGLMILMSQGLRQILFHKILLQAKFQKLKQSKREEKRNDISTSNSKALGSCPG